MVLPRIDYNMAVVEYAKDNGLVAMSFCTNMKGEPSPSIKFCKFVANLRQRNSSTNWQAQT